MEGLVVERAKLLYEDPLSHPIVTVFGKNRQLRSFGELWQKSRLKLSNDVASFICSFVSADCSEMQPSLLRAPLGQYLQQRSLQKATKGILLRKKRVFNGRRLCHIFSVTLNVSSLPLCQKMQLKSAPMIVLTARFLPLRQAAHQQAQQQGEGSHAARGSTHLQTKTHKIHAAPTSL